MHRCDEFLLCYFLLGPYSLHNGWSPTSMHQNHQFNFDYTIMRNALSAFWVSSNNCTRIHIIHTIVNLNMGSIIHLEPVTNYIKPIQF